MVDSPPIALEHLSYRYHRAERPAVDRISFSVQAGEIVGLLGPNGAGKTTTLHAILGLLEPTGGAVRVFGRCPIRQRLEVLPRLNFASAIVDLPSNLSVSEVLQIFARLYTVRHAKPRIEELLERFDLIQLRTRLVGSLSSGEHTRLKLCKALLNDPDLLILDEPTLSLDPYMAQRARQLLKAVQQTRRLAILHTSHNMQEVEAFCDRILFLHRGTLLADGPAQAILNRFHSRTLEELFIRVSRGGELSDEPVA